MSENKIKICGIYKITSPSKKVYIGQSIDCLHRKGQYRRLHCMGQRKLYRSIIKHGWEAHHFEIIHQLEVYNKEELNRLEEYYGGLFDCNSKDTGLNLKICGGSKGKNSEESKQIQRAKMIGRKLDIAHVEKIKQALIARYKVFPGKPPSIESIERSRIVNRGNKYSCGKRTPEQIQEITRIARENAYKRVGSKRSDETKLKLKKMALLREANKRKNGTNKRTPDAIEKSRISMKNKWVERKASPDWYSSENILNRKRSMGMYGLNHHSAKILLNTQVGVFYYSIKEAAESLNMPQTTFQRRLKSNSLPIIIA